MRFVDSPSWPGASGFTLDPGMPSNRLNLISRSVADNDVTRIDRHASSLTPTRVAEAIALGLTVKDYDFDRFLPDALRIVSSQHWTPTKVAVRVADWLVDAGVETVVDVGSGAGKLCVVAALRCDLRFHGVEQRERLVLAARALARRFDVTDRVTFSCATFEGDVPVADAYYLYNPFGENLFEAQDFLDDDVELGRERFMRDVTHVHRMLEQAAVGTYIVTYNGFGGFVPETYEEARSDLSLPNVLRMWRKVRA